MSWSIPLGRVAGSEIRIHLTFLILLAWIGVAAYLQAARRRRSTAWPSSWRSSPA